jgi:hypothetical protein
MAESTRYIALLAEMVELHRRKNAGYVGKDNEDAWANFREAEEFGVSTFQGVLIRMSDKYARIRSLVRNPDNEQVGEAITDTLMDLAAYALIAICIHEENQCYDVVRDQPSIDCVR